MSDAMDVPGASASDSIDVPGARIDRVYTPDRVESMSEILEVASRERRGLLIVGGRTRLGLGNPAREIDAALSLGAWTGVDEFEPDEGVLHARSGTPLVEIRALAESEGWELPLDPPGLTSTVGGTIASAATGPRAQAFGGVSDAILGLDVCGAEGVPSKCGGRVVKNVTGYDLAKLYCGSFGSLAVVTGAWLRLRPLPTRRLTLLARGERGARDLDRARALARLSSVRACVWSDSPDADGPELIVELGGSPEGVSHDRARIAEHFDVSDSSDDAIDRLRDARAEHAESVVAVRARVLGTACAAMVETAFDLGLDVSVDPGLGVVVARGGMASVDGLRALRAQAFDGGGFAVFERLPDAWRKDVDVFGEEGGHEALIASIKNRFDPAGILNPGRFAGGV